MVTENNLIDTINGVAISVIGFLGVYIAWRQWETTAYRYKLDLFEKRFVIYEAVIDFIISIRGGGKVIDVELSKFKDITLPARFIFNDEIADYLSEIKEKAIDLQTYAAEVDGIEAGDEKIKTLKLSSEVKKWLYKQIDEQELNQRFGSLMKVSPKISFIRRITRKIQSTQKTRG